MKLKTLKRRMAHYLVNHILSGARFFSAKRRLLRSCGYEIGEGTKIVGPLFCTGTLRIGHDCWIGRNLAIEGNGSVIIGNCCDIAPGVTFFTGGHRIGSAGRRAGKGESYQITVGNGVWIGGRATILRNAHIGDGSVIAACACVVGDIPRSVLAAGVPAKPVKELDENAAED